VRTLLYLLSLVDVYAVVQRSYGVLGMTLNFIHIFIVTGSFLYCCVMRSASQRFFIHSCIYVLILIISYSATFLGTNSLSVLMCRKAINQSVNQRSYALRKKIVTYFHHIKKQTFCCMHCHTCSCKLFSV